MKKVLFCFLLVITTSCHSSLQDDGIFKLSAFCHSLDFVSERFQYLVIDWGSPNYGWEQNPVLGNRGIITLSITAINRFGEKKNYLCTIHMVYKGADRYEEMNKIENWSYSKLVIEDLSSGKEYTFKYKIDSLKL